MRPVALSDESLDRFDAEEMAEFEHASTGHGRARKRDDRFSIFDDQPEDNAEDDLSEYGLDAGFVDHD